MIESGRMHRDFIKLSDRLMMSAAMVSRGSRIADVGCDHAHTDIWLVKEGIAESAIAMDVGEGPLSHALANIDLYGLSDKISVRLSDGLENLKPGEADTVIIAGMGGTLMTLILDNGFEVLKTLDAVILQPQSDIWMVRRFLREHGFRIMEENMCIEEGKFYNSMKAVPTGGNVSVISDIKIKSASGELPYSCRGRDYELSDEQLTEDEFGRLLLERKDSVLKRLLEIMRKKNTAVLSEITANGGSGTEERRILFEREKVLLERAFDYYK